MPSRIYTISTQFDQKFMPGQIRPVEFEIRPVEYGLLKAILSQWIYTIYTQFDQLFMPGRIYTIYTQFDQ